MSSRPIHAVTARIRAHRQVWRDLVEAVGPDRVDEPGPMGEWTFRDVASHLLGWRDIRIASFEAAARGEPEPPLPWPGDLTDDDPINAWIREQATAQSARAVLDAYDASFERLATALEALPDDVLAQPALFPWMEGSPLLEGDYLEHLDEHAGEVRAWPAERP